MARLFARVLVTLLLVAACLGQTGKVSTSQTEAVEKLPAETTLEKIRDLPAEWLIGPYIPSTKPLTPLTSGQRREVYIDQTFGNFSAYFARMFTGGIDQARGVPAEWGGGMGAYGERFASRYGRFAIANTFHSVGNAALGYEPRYDLCRCRGFWPRARHAVVRNFVTYNRSEVERRPAIPLYAGSYGAGMISSAWLPGHRNVWKEGAYSALGQAEWGSAINFVSEFAIDILRKVTSRRYPKKP